MKKTLLASAWVFSTLVVVCTAAATQVQAPRSFDQVAISPDGNHLAWIGPSSEEGSGLTPPPGIYVKDLSSSDSKARRITATTGETANEGSIAWSRDSKRIAFLSDAGNSGQLQLYVADVAGGPVHKLTTLTGYLSDPIWSPDGKTIAFLFIENAPRVAGPLMPMTPETGVIESKIYEQRLALADVASGKVRALSPEDMYIYEYDWSPDGRSFAVIAAHGEGDSNWYVAQLYALAVTSGEMKPLHKPPLQIAVPRWSPDGKSIAFIGGLMSDEGSTGGDIFIVPAGGGEARNSTPEIAASPSALQWISPDRILFTETVDGETGIGTVDLSSGKISTSWSGPEIVKTERWGAPDVSLSADQLTSVVIRTSSEHPPEVWVGPIGQWKQFTYANDSVRPAWGEMKSLHWMNDGMRIQGWLMFPKDYDPHQRYPMVVVPHGGPGAAELPGWPGSFFNLYELSTHGYFVLFPNPRGSFGHGEKFARANVKDFGYGDFRDILAGVDEIVKTLPVDNDRIGITGWSYGGYMTMWAVTQTNRFRAAVSGAGLSDFQSYYGQNDIDAWLIPYFGASVYDDPAVYARSSPITFIKNVRTPTLILVGERDGECPAPQSREFWHALRDLGVETQYVVYAGEGHAILQGEHQRDVMNRMKAWFDRYLKNEPGKTAAQ